MQAHGRQIRIWMWLCFFIIFPRDYKLEKREQIRLGVNNVKVIFARPRYYPHKYAPM